MYDTGAVHEKLAPLEESTRAGHYGAILAIVKSEKMKKSLLDHYQEIFDTLRELKKARTAVGERTEKQAANWLTWEEVMAATHDPKLTPIQKLVGALYTLLPPRRNADYLHLQLDSDTGNWYDTKEGALYFTKYKTSATYGKQKIEAPPELKRIIMDYVGSAGLKKNDYFLGNERSATKLTRIVNSIFKKKIGPTMLRHIYLTSKYGEEKEEMRRDAMMMAHSTGMQSDYIIN